MPMKRTRDTRPGAKGGKARQGKARQGKARQEASSTEILHV
jgi:hypothetical protein